MNTRRWWLLCATHLLVVIAAWGWLALPSPGMAAPALTCPPVAPTQYFTFVYGAVTLNGVAAPAGAIVEARSPRGDTVGCTTVETAGLYPLMYIYGEETLGGETTAGMRADEAVSFYVDGIAATPTPAFTWVNSWQSARVDLAASGDIPTPTANFTASPTSGVAPLAVQFTDASTGTITARSWDFGDGGTSTAQNPAYSFTTPGVYTVTLTVTGPGGSNTKTRASYITVNHPPPVADFFGSPTSGVAPLAVQFTDVSTGTVTSRSWNFGDGGTSTAQNPAYSFTTPGVYTVTLTVTGPGGSNTKTRASYITVTQSIDPPPTPVASFTVTPEQGMAPLAVQFTDTSIGVITAWVWAFGDGSNATQRHPSHTYTLPGVYTATLNVSGPYGGHNTAQQVRVAPPPPTFTITLPASGGLTVYFTFDPPPGVTHWLWAFGDGATSTAQNPAHTYAAPGDYVVRLTVYTAGGLSATHERAVQVQEGSSQAEFSQYLPAVIR